MSENVKNEGEEALLKSIGADLDELTSLTKSYFEKVSKAEGEPGGGGQLPDQVGDLIHAADEGQTGDTLVEYARSLSPEELQAILSALMDVYEEQGQATEQPPAESMPAQGDGSEGMPESTDKSNGTGMVPPTTPVPPPVVDPMLGKAKEAPPAEMPPQEDLGLPDMPPEEGEVPPMEGAPAEGMPPEGMPPEGMAPEAGGMDEGALIAELQGLSPEEMERLKMAIQQVEAGSAMKSLKLPKETGGDKEADGSKNTISGKAFTSLAKSIDTLSKKLDKIESTNEELKKSIANRIQTPKVEVPSQKYADANVKVLEKSTDSSAEQMDGMGLANWLITEQRKGNRLVKSMLVTRANLAKSEDEVRTLYTELKGLGITPPNKS